MNTYVTVPQRIRTRVGEHPNAVHNYTRENGGPFVPTTYAEMWEQAGAVAEGLMDLGVKRGDHVGLMSDNRKEWIYTDLAILSIGAADVPRGSDSTADEIAYILGHADCRVAVVENRAQLDKVIAERSRLPKLEILVIFDSPEEDVDLPKGLTLVAFADLLAKGVEIREKDPAHFDKEIDEGGGDDLATILYTSGTTGEPKGVLLSHRSFIFQMDRIQNILLLDDTDIFLSILPVWHSFERSVQYIVHNYCCAVAYSKPIGKIMLEDMAEVRPTWMTSVPRIWESVRAGVFRNAAKESAFKRALFRFFVGIGQSFATLSNYFLGRAPQFNKRSRILDILWSAAPLALLFPLKALGSVLVFKKLRQRLGGRFVAGVSGGGALPPYVDKFFQAAGIKLLEGYGLTETGPILSVRPQKRPVPGTIGPLLPDVEFRVLGDDGTVLPPGRKGVLWVKSDQLMEGYYKRPEETDKVIKDGWLNTGDLAMYTHTGEFRILGRVKETIVLLGGENVEPAPIEETLVQSDYIEQAMVIGQDQRTLKALIVPNEEKLDELAKELGVDAPKATLVKNESIRAKYWEEVRELISSRRGFKPFEQIYGFTIADRPFEVGVEMTRTLKKKREVIYQTFRKEIGALLRK